VRVLWLPLALLGLPIAGCGSHVADETGDPPTDVGALADIELDDWCAPVQALDFEVRGAGRPMQLGACGHLHVDDGQHRLLHPDGHEEWLDTDTAAGVTLHLSATGHLVAWGQRWGGVRLRDLRNDSPAWVSAQGVESFGFVRTLDPELGARLWTCGDAGLALDDTAGTEVLSPTANCNAIVAAGGRARLLFADALISGTVTTVDIDTGTLHATAVDDFEHVFPTGLGDHADRLTISYDGRLAVHEVVVEVDDGAIGEQVVLGHRLIELAGGQIIATCAYPTWLQAEHAGAPLWVRCNEELFHFDDTLQRIDGAPRGTGRVAAQAGVLVIDLDGVLVRLHPDAATLPETIAELSTSARGLEISASGDAIAFVDDLTLFRWTATRGLEAFGTSRASHSSAAWRILALADDGQLLAWAQLDGDDQARPFVIDADGQRTELDALGGRPNAEGTFADGRVLVRSQVDESDTQSLVIIDPSDRSASVVMGPTPADMPTLYLPAARAIDPRSQLVAGSIGGYEGALYFGNGL
jgi:hypothetical protein